MVHAPIARVSTGITETGQDRLPAEIEFACPGGRKGENFVVRADREEPAAADRDRLRARFLAPINAIFYRGRGNSPQRSGTSAVRARPRIPRAVRVSLADQFIEVISKRESGGVSRRRCRRTWLRI